MCTTSSALCRASFVSSFIVRLGSKKLSRLYHHHRQGRYYRGLLGQCLTRKLLEFARSPDASDPRQVKRWLVPGRTGLTSGSVPGALSKQQAKELAVRLTSEEREVLISALHECQSQKTRAEYEGQLAAFRWRSKFGRPSRVPTLGDVDPTGTYCTVPEDWLLRKYAETVPPPCRNDLIRVLVANAIPFIGFGFLDNFIMIIAGDQIETSVGAVISLSTMAAAAFGNTISDILGIGSAVYVELLAQKIGFQPPKLTPIQLDMPKSRRAANLGRVLGVTIGCLLGMTPLVILHQETKEPEESAPKSK